MASPDEPLDWRPRNRPLGPPAAPVDPFALAPIPTTPFPTTPGRQSAALQQAITVCAASGWRLEGTVGGVATMVFGNDTRPNHILHLLLTVFTCGFWAPFWLLIGVLGATRAQRLLVIADEAGNVTYRKAA